MLVTMQTKLPIQWMPDVDETENSVFPRVVIVYDDVPAGKQGLRVLSNVVDEPKDEFESRPQLWRFDLLEDPEWSALALTDAINADIIVIATSVPNGFGAAVKSWIELCMARKRGTCAAIVALLGPAENLDGPDSPRFQFVRGAAQDAGLEFLAPQSRRAHSTAPKTAGTVGRRAARTRGGARACADWIEGTEA